MTKNALLGLYRDGRHYDLKNQNVTSDIPFYLEVALESKGPVLELCSGTGRLAIPLAKAGLSMTGLDITPSMQKQARRKAKAENVEIEWVEGDIRAFDLGRKIALILVPFNSMQHLHTLSELEGLFDCVKRHLLPNGRFIVDVFNPWLSKLTLDPDKRFEVATYPDPDGDGEVVITEQIEYEDTTQVVRIAWYCEINGKKDASIDLFGMRCFFPQELNMLLHYNGFEIVEKYGDFDKSPFVSGSPKQIVVCRTQAT